MCVFCLAVLLESVWVFVHLPLPPLPSSVFSLPFKPFRAAFFSAVAWNLSGLCCFCQVPLNTECSPHPLLLRVNFNQSSWSGSEHFRAASTKARMSRRPWKPQRQNHRWKPEGRHRGGGLFEESSSFLLLSLLCLLFSRPLEAWSVFSSLRSTCLSQHDASDLRFCCSCVVIRQHGHSHCSH